MGDEEKEWYSNKQLFEQLDQFKDNFRDLRVEMEQTRSTINKYNGLYEEVGKAREEIDAVKGQVNKLQERAKGRSAAWNGIKSWGGWIVAILTMVAGYLKLIM
ncbi:uncharacterized coiled-coil DUF342 family protein [Salibacterium salarium]|uniref:hypothetical protein n=1 Tax=Salibacterium salarium TaxID=284579 RepID=UPI00278212D0|nr:hypothetical protein [Salibacterium salarium]MDQ0299621.1 uncharacterized coiled-coil DUF342 family protein [Salibacterium salarium]